MDNPETTTAAQTELSEVRTQLEDLKHLVVSTLVLLLIVSGAFNLYMLRQWRFSKTDLASARPQVQQIVAEFNKSSASMSDFIKRLAEYGRSHPDFAPIVAKYRLNDLAGKVSAPPATAAPPAIAPAATPGAAAPAAAPGAASNKK